MSFNPYVYDLSRSAWRPVQPGIALAQALPGVPAEAQQVLWDGLMEAVDGLLDLMARTPNVQREPPAFTVQHTGKPIFNDAHLRQQTQKDWHRLVGLELRLAAQVLEALILTGRTEQYLPLLREQCARVGQLFRELTRRVGTTLARIILKGGVHLLRYRDSPVVAPLIYD